MVVGEGPGGETDRDRNGTRDSQVEGTGRDRDDQAQCDDGGNRLEAEDLLEGADLQEEIRDPQREHDDERCPHVKTTEAVKAEIDSATWCYLNF